LLIANGKHSFTFGIWTIGLDPIWHLGKIVRDSASASAMKFTAADSATSSYRTMVASILIYHRFIYSLCFDLDMKLG
jgi:hypothetical protein